MSPRARPPSPIGRHYGIHLRVTLAERELINAVAQARGVTRPELFRELIESLARVDLSCTDAVDALPPPRGPLVLPDDLIIPDEYTKEFRRAWREAERPGLPDSVNEARAYLIRVLPWSLQRSHAPGEPERWRYSSHKGDIVIETRVKRVGCQAKVVALWADFPEDDEDDESGVISRSSPA